MSTSPGSNSRPRSPSREHLLVGRQARGDRHRARAERAHEQPGRGAMPSEAATTHVGGREHRVLGRVRSDRSSARGRAARERTVGAAPVGDEHGRLPVQPRSAAAAARAGTAAAPRAPPGRRTRSAAGPSYPRAHRRATRPGAAPRTPPGRTAASARAWPRTTPCGRRGGRRTARRSGARPASRARARRARGTSPDVERARVAQRDRRRARRERLVHVHEVERRDHQHLLDRARDVQRERRHRAATGAGQRQQLAHAEDRGRRRRGHRAPRRGSAGGTRAPARDRATARAPRPGGPRRPARRRERGRTR